MGAHPKVQFSCAKCGMKTVVDTRRHPNATMVISPLPSFARGNGSGSTNILLQHDHSARLPATQTVVLTIIAGPGKGAEHPLSKPRVVVGREGADIALQDPEISRHHCVVEVRDDLRQFARPGLHQRHLLRGRTRPRRHARPRRSNSASAKPSYASLSNQSKPVCPPRPPRHTGRHPDSLAAARLVRPSRPPPCRSPPGFSFAAGAGLARPALPTRNTTTTLAYETSRL